MFDFGELIVIAVVALIALGPERLPQTARTMGQWLGRLQNYVSQMRAEVDREFHLADLRNLGEQARSGVRSVETAVRGTVSGVQSEIGKVRADLMTPMEGNSWASGGPPPPPLSFTRRYRPRPTIDELTQEIERLKQQMALPDASLRARGRFAPRGRINRVRIRR